MKQLAAALVLPFLILLFFQNSFAQKTDFEQLGSDPRWLNNYWTARWIAHAEAAGRQYGVFHFRKSIDLPAMPRRFVVHVSADNRYQFFVNGKSIGRGPARSDPQHWNFESYDIAPLLKAGRNTLAALVWNAGENAPFAQMSYRTAFLLQGDTEAEAGANTDDSWRVLLDSAYAPEPLDMAKMQAYMVVGDGDRIRGERYPWGWEMPGFDDSRWPAAKPLWFGAKARGLGSDGNFALVPRSIPQPEERPQRLARLARHESDKKLGFEGGDFPGGPGQVRIPAGTKASLLLDQGFLTNAHPKLTVSGGKNARIAVSYAEALLDDKREKGHRDSIRGKQIIGLTDVFLPGGGPSERFEPLWWRCYRYVQLDIETAGEPLVIADFSGTFTGFPFREAGRFRSSDPRLAKVWEVGWRTARLCAGETYFDCPYYEQLQYTGDTRVQALVSLYVAGDDRLMRKAIADFDNSRLAEGLTQSRYPCNDPQFIPPFSLFWVSMLHDFWMHRSDDAFLRRYLPGLESVLQWHEDRLDPATGLNGSLSWWNFVDWAWPWMPEERYGGVPKGSFTGGSSILSLQFAITLRQAADLMEHFGRAERAAHYRSLAHRICQSVYEKCWSPQRGLLADTPAKTDFSQHANIWAVLSDAVPAPAQQAVLEKTMRDSSLRQATFYFKFYLFQALKKTGLGDAFLPQLQPWHDMLALGLSTFAEQPDPTRSDCHAWSASPLREFLATVCGIGPASPGFRTVRIEPFLGDLAFAEGSLPHPAGPISVRFEKTAESGLRGEVELPPGVSGEVVWRGKIKMLAAGKQTISL